MPKPSFVLKPGAMRVVLALIVMATHYVMFCGVPVVTRVDGVPVYGFFFLSGYWVSRLWENEYLKCDNPILTFYVSRALRIYPLATIGTVLMIAALVLGGRPINLHDIPMSLLLFPDHDINPPAWSLVVEVQFYLVAPFLFPLLKRPAWAALVAAIAFAGWLLFALGVDSGPRSLLHFVFPFVLGGIWANWPFEKLAARLAPYSFGALIFFGIVFNVIAPVFGIEQIDGLVRSQEMLVALLFFPAVAASVSIESDARDRQLSNYAYPLYLFHFPAWVFVQSAIPSPVGALVLAILLTLTLIGLAIIFVDWPIEARRKKWVRSRSTPAPEMRTQPSLQS
jgi:peptidoglycan/LPS O-acetylase OafA/YrhL